MGVERQRVTGRSLTDGSVAVRRLSDIGGFPRKPMMPAHSTTPSIPPTPGRERRLLCLGGSFNPIHLGHLVTARAAAKALHLPGVRLIPTPGNPHKAGQETLPAAIRLELCQLAVADDPFFVVDSIEYERPPPIYTYDTARLLADRAGGRVPWLIGSDLLPRLHEWHRFDDLIPVIELVLMLRSGHEQAAPLDAKTIALVSRVVEVPALPISSTAVRDRARRGESLEGWVPPDVARAIHDRRLYQAAGK